MTTAQQFGDYYYDSRFSPPVSPKSLPHGCKRKASIHDDELETNSLISNLKSFKKLRLGSAKRPSAVDLPPVGIAYRDVDPQQPPSGRDLSHLHDFNRESEDGGMMSVDDTSHKIWVGDLDAEIAEIEANEAREKNEALLSDAAGQEIGKIPQHLLRSNTANSDERSNMQMILYKDPISISVPEEHDAVRKTIIEARRRVREKQAEDLHRGSSSESLTHSTSPIVSADNDDEEDSMDID